MRGRSDGKEEGGEKKEKGRKEGKGGGERERNGSGCNIKEG